MRILVYIGIAAVLFVPLHSTVYAQLGGSFAELQISLSPEYPQPGQQVTAEVFSTSANIRASHVTWLVDGDVQSQGPGKATLQFRAGALGSTQVLSAIVETPSGTVLTDSVTLRPAVVTLLWEGDTYTPPFYRGRSLYSSGSLVRAHALAELVAPSGRPYTSRELVYTWSKNGSVLNAQSGIGADSIITPGPLFLGDYILSVRVATPDNSQVARSSVYVVTTEPVAKIYEFDPLVGVMYHRAITDNYGFAVSPQLEMQAEPYFMDVSGASDPLLSYTWSIDDTRVENENKSRLPVSLATESDIRTHIELIIEHGAHLLQSARNVYEVEFEGTGRSSIFGI